MILGTYWYFAFPTDLYKFDYFEFKQGYGGHADNPAELITNIETENPDKIITLLKSLVEKHKQGFIFVYQDGEKLKIGTGGYQLFDYDFLLILEIEKILKQEKIKLVNNQKLDNPTFIRIQNDNSLAKIVYPKKTFLQIVGSELKKQNAENSKLRLDCNINPINKYSFIADLKRISIEERIDVFYYYEKDFENKTNLMLFFTNGRQGMNFSEKKIINTINFENKVEEVIIRHNAKYGHVSGFELYPQNGPKIEMIIEEEYII